MDPRRLDAEQYRVVQRIAIRVADLRKSRGETQAMLGKVLRISHQQVVKLERAECAFSLWQLYAVSRHYGITMLGLLGDIDDGDETIGPYESIRLEISRAARGVGPEILRAVLVLLRTV